jgi:uncharacterized repeat protein (TIGR01451 family)
VEHKRLSAVLTLATAILLTRVADGLAQTGTTPPPGSVIAESAPHASAPMTVGKRPTLIPLAEATPVKGEAQAPLPLLGEKPPAFRRIEAQPLAPIRQPEALVPNQRRVSSAEPPLAQGLVKQTAPVLPSAPAVVAPAPQPAVAPAPLVADAATAPLGLVVQAPERIALGENVTFTLQVSNSGATQVDRVTVRDRLPAGLQHPEGDYLEVEVGTLAPGESKKLELTAKAVEPGSLLNQAQALIGDGVQATTTTSVTVAEAALQLRQVGEARPALGKPSDYRVEIVNRSDRDLHGVQLQVRLPAGLDYVATEGAADYDAASRAVRWRMSTLAAGQKREVLVRLMPRAPGVQVSQLRVRADDAPEVVLDTPLQVQALEGPRVQIKLVGPETGLTVGRELVYEVHVANPGTTALQGVRLSAFLPAGIVPRRGEGPTAARVQGQQIVFDPLPSLAPQSQVVFRVRVLGQRPSSGRMQVRVHADQLPSPLQWEYGLTVERLGAGRRTDQQLNNR